MTNTAQETQIIIPTILEKDGDNIIKKINLIKDVCSVFQIDIVDGKFCEGKSLTDVKFFENFQMEDNINIELHLMVQDPMEFLKHKLPKVFKFSAHVENKNVDKIISASKSLDYVTGLSINPQTPLNELNPYVQELDFVQFLTVVPGKQGNKLLPEAIEKIKEFKKIYPTILVQADGGINNSNLNALLQAGLDNAVIGSQIWRSENPKESYLHLTKMAAHEKNKTEINSLSDIKTYARIKKIAFLGGSSWKENEQPYKDALEVAKILSENGYEIVNGGGPGVMEASTKGAHAAQSRALAITYHPNKPKRHYEGVGPNNDFDEEILTLDYFDRTKVMLQNTDVHIVFKGSIGTLSEFGMTWVSSWIHEPNSKPIILYGNFWNEILDTLDKTMLIKPAERQMLKVCTSPQEVLEYIISLE